MTPPANDAAPTGLAGTTGSAPSSEREPDGFCVWCHAPYYESDETYANPITREVHCSKECSDEHDANL